VSIAAQAIKERDRKMLLSKQAWERMEAHCQTGNMGEFWREYIAELEREIAESHFCSRYRAILLDAAKQTVQQL
jgi:hypothetical protein